MAKVRLIANEEHVVPELGDRLVQPDEVVTVPDDRFDAYVLQTALWESVEEPKPAPEPDPAPEAEGETETGTAAEPAPEAETGTDTAAAPAPARARKATAPRAAARKGGES